MLKTRLSVLLPCRQQPFLFWRTCVVGKRVVGEFVTRQHSTQSTECVVRTGSHVSKQEVLQQQRAATSVKFLFCRSVYQNAEVLNGSIVLRKSLARSLDTLLLVTRVTTGEAGNRQFARDFLAWKLVHTTSSYNSTISQKRSVFYSSTSILQRSFIYRLLQKYTTAAISGEPVEVKGAEDIASKSLSFIYLRTKFHPPSSNTEKVIDRQRRRWGIGKTISSAPLHKRLPYLGSRRLQVELGTMR